MVALLAPEIPDSSSEAIAAGSRLVETPQFHTGIARLPEDLKLPSILPHREVFDFLGRVANVVSRAPATGFGWMFENSRPWSRFLD
jgi:hypothetical protein